MAPKFGTSGLRGLVSDLTPDLVADHVRAFVAACDMGQGVFVGRDLRASSPAIAETVMATVQGEGLAVTDCGATPTPALALAAMEAGAAAVMVTGSHIPDDRNGLKFYTPTGEITKPDEAAILSALGRGSAGMAGARAQVDVNAPYAARYVAAYGADALAGLDIGVYSHSAVGRDLLIDLLRALGARVTELGRADSFVPVDTEAVDDATRAQLTEWARAHALDAIVSTDGDGDRPLVADARGQVIAGDVLGQITAAALGADVVVTPVSSNTGAERAGVFAQVIRTRIGSPHVIAGMTGVPGRAVGYEANGGFLSGFTAAGPAGDLPALMTRDAALPIIAALHAARAGGLAALVAMQPARFTAADRLTGVEMAQAQALLAHLSASDTARQRFADGLGSVIATDLTDGLRMTLAGGAVVHLRPSGNAPEFRVYVETDAPDSAAALLAQVLQRVAQALGQGDRQG